MEGGCFLRIRVYNGSVLSLKYFRMNKSIILVVIIIVALGGGLFFLTKKGAQAPSDASETAEQEGGLGQTGEAPSVISSIKDAMGMNAKMACTYNDPSGQVPGTATVYIQGNTFKSVADVNGTQTSALFDGETMYMWTAGQAQGFKMPKSCMDEFQTNAPKPADYERTFESAQDVRCEASEGADFSIPTNVTFIDQCEMMKQNDVMMKSMQQGQMPAGMMGQ